MFRRSPRAMPGYFRFPPAGQRQAEPFALVSTDAFAAHVGAFAFLAVFGWLSGLVLAKLYKIVAAAFSAGAAAVVRLVRYATFGSNKAGGWSRIVRGQQSSGRRLKNWFAAKHRAFPAATGGGRR